MDTKILENFIINNNLKFREGSRNTDSTILSGFALHNNINDTALIITIIKQVLPDASNFEDEFQRVFSYAKVNDYGKWWENKK